MSETSQKDECNFRQVSAYNCRHCKYMPEQKREKGRFVKFVCQKHTEIRLLFPDTTVCDDFTKSERYGESYWSDRNA